MEAKSKLSEAFRRLLAAISEAKNLQQPLKHRGFLYVLRKRRFRSLESFRSLLEFAVEPSLAWISHDDNIDEADHTDDNSDDGGSKNSNSAYMV